MGAELHGLAESDPDRGSPEPAAPAGPDVEAAGHPAGDHRHPGPEEDPDRPSPQGLQGPVPGALTLGVDADSLARFESSEDDPHRLGIDAEATHGHAVHPGQDPAEEGASELRALRQGIDVVPGHGDLHEDRVEDALVVRHQEKGALRG